MTYEVTEMPGAPRRGLLERLVFRGIVFNMSWEDPEMDRQALRVAPDDVVLSITSAGCNPLNLLCQSPRRLICIDSNPAQTALLELKLAGLAGLDYETFFDIFGARRPRRVVEVYRPRLRARLSPRARRYWDRNLWMVYGDLYRYGRMGLFVRVLRVFLRALGIDLRRADEFFNIRHLDEQQRWYQRHVAHRLWGRRGARWVRAFVNSRPLMYLAGVHPRQFDLVDRRHDMFEYIRERVEYALTRVPIHDNYFLSMAITGRFRNGHVPPYLLPQNFDTLRRNLSRVHVVNGWLGPFLDAQPPASIDCFNLLDIFDWMTPAQFEATLHSILRAAAPGARLIYRSGSYRLDPPATIAPHLEPHSELARTLLSRDRSATYGSFYVFTVRNHMPARAPAPGATRAAGPRHPRPGGPEPAHASADSGGTHP